MSQEMQIVTLIFVITLIPSILLLSLPWLLRKRGVRLARGVFGLILIFESTNADGQELRLLNVNGTFQSVSYTQKTLRFIPACSYHRSMVLVLKDLLTWKQCSSEQPLRVLVVGGGGYSLPKYLMTHSTRIDLTVVEIDPKMEALARSDFYLDEALAAAAVPNHVHLKLGDGWAYVKEQVAGGVHFDVIVNDAFAGNKPLGPLEVHEGAKLLAAALADDGVYLANVRSLPVGTPLFEAASHTPASAQLKGLKRRGTRPLTLVYQAFLTPPFKHLALIPERAEKPLKRGNNVFIASKTYAFDPTRYSDV